MYATDRWLWLGASGRLLARWGVALLRAPRRFWPLLEESVVAAHARPSKVAGSMWVAGRVGETRRGAKGQ